MPLPRVSLVARTAGLTLALVVLPSIARATVMTPLDLPALNARAEVVISGRVVEQHAAWTAEHDAIYTDVTVHIDRVLKGPLAAGQEMVVRREGGSVDGVGMKVFGAPSFSPAEEVVLFVERRGVARYVVGMAQGKLRILTDVAGHKRFSRDLAEVSYTRPLSPSERALSTSQGGQPPHPIETVDELAAEITRLERARIRR